MRCFQLIGSKRGHIIDLPYAAYQSCRDSGTVADLDDPKYAHWHDAPGSEPVEPVETVVAKKNVETKDEPGNRGLTIPILPPDNVVAIEIPADWMEEHHNKKRSWASDISGKPVGTKAEAEEIIKTYLAKQ